VTEKLKYIMNTLFVYYNFELGENKIVERLEPYLNNQVGLSTRSLRYNLPDKFINHITILKFGLPHFFINSDYVDEISDKVLAINLKDLKATPQEIVQLFDKIGDTEPLIQDGFFGISRTCYMNVEE
jgi:hypothetical protein